MTDALAFKMRVRAGLKRLADRIAFLKPRPDERKKVGKQEKRDMEAALRSDAMNGDATEAAELIREGVNVNAKDGEGWSPLMYAATNGRPEMCALLIMNGAEIGAMTRGFFGLTALAITSHKPEPPRIAETVAFLKTMESMQRQMGKRLFKSFMLAFGKCASG